MDVNTRISNFYNSNPDKQKYIKGVTASGKVLLKNGEKEVYAFLDDLEKNTFNWSEITGETIELPKVEEPTVNQTVQMPTIEPQMVQPQPTIEPTVTPQPVQTATPESVVTPQPVVMPSTEAIPMPTTEQPTSVTPVNIPQTQSEVITPDVKPANNTSLADVKTLFELSTTNPESANTLNQIIKTFAANENGEADLNKAQQIVQNNGIELSVNAIKNQKGLPIELYKYKADGTLISNDEVYPFTNNDEIIERTFNNALIYANNIPQENIATIKEMYKKMVNDKLQAKNEEIPEVTAPMQNSKKLELINSPEEKAGFADIFILVLIVAIYAVIIVNLILKIK